MRLVSCEVVQNSYRISDKYQSDFIGELGMAIAVLTLECQEFGLAGQKFKSFGLHSESSRRSGELVLAIDFQGSGVF